MARYTLNITYTCDDGTEIRASIDSPTDPGAIVADAIAHAVSTAIAASDMHAAVPAHGIDPTDDLFHPKETT